MLQKALQLGVPWRWLITLLVTGAVIALSVVPGRSEPGDTIFNWLVLNTSMPIQKALHVAIYAGLAFLWMWTLESVNQRALRIAFALLLTVGLGAGLELYQTRVPGRFGTIADVILNGAGAALGLLAALLIL